MLVSVVFVVVFRVLVVGRSRILLGVRCRMSLVLGYLVLLSVLVVVMMCVLLSWVRNC